MAYRQDRYTRHYQSWNKNTTITEDVADEGNTRLAKVSITNSKLGISAETDWLKTPFENNKTISDIVLETVPALKQSPDFFPIVETTGKEKGRPPLCSAYVLKDKSEYKQYRLISETLKWYKMYLDRPSDFLLSNGSHAVKVSPSDVIEILEE